MNKFVYAIGLLSSIGISSQVLFKIMHWPFSSIILMISLVGLTFIFIPKLAWDMLSANNNRSLIDKTRIISGFSSSIIILFSMLFKMQHLAGASVLLILGFFAFILVFLPLLFYYLGNRAK